MSSETDTVHLGSGFYCTQAGFTAMETAKNDCDWTVALLVGVFGEDAKLMRIYPRKPGLKKFPLGFLMLAQNLYRQRLKDSNYEADIDEAVKSLPAYLADRALDLEGGRNITSRAKRFKKSNNDNYILKRKKAAVSSAVLTATAPISTVPLTSQSPCIERKREKACETSTCRRSSSKHITKYPYYMPYTFYKYCNKYGK